jgi:hypothetical protein
MKFIFTVCQVKRQEISTRQSTTANQHSLEGVIQTLRLKTLHGRQRLEDLKAQSHGRFPGLDPTAEAKTSLPGSTQNILHGGRFHQVQGIGYYL